MNSPRYGLLLVSAVCATAFQPLLLCAQLENVDSAEDERFGPAETQRFRVGVEITASRGQCRNVLAMIAVPFACPEQDVQILEEQLSPEVRKVTYRTIDQGVRQMLVHVPMLRNGEVATAIVSFEVRTQTVKPPLAPEELRIPKTVRGPLKKYLGTSPFIESRHRQIRDLAREIVDELPSDATDWQKLEAIYDRVQADIEYVEGPDKSAIRTLQDGQGDCQAISAVFVALCRSMSVPARLVWVENHCYPEFYLENADGEGHWYPSESAGQKAFGKMPTARIIFQKGDNFRIPERPKDRLRYASDWAKGVPAPGGGKPRVKFIRERE